MHSKNISLYIFFCSLGIYIYIYIYTYAYIQSQALPLRKFVSIYSIYLGEQTFIINNDGKIFPSPRWESNP